MLLCKVHLLTMHILYLFIYAKQEPILVHCWEPFFNVIYSPIYPNVQIIVKRWKAGLWINVARIMYTYFKNRCILLCVIFFIDVECTWEIYWNFFFLKVSSLILWNVMGKKKELVSQIFLNFWTKKVKAQNECQLKVCA